MSCLWCASLISLKILWPLAFQEFCFLPHILDLIYTSCDISFHFLFDSICFFILHLVPLNFIHCDIWFISPSVLQLHTNKTKAHIKQNFKNWRRVKTNCHLEKCFHTNVFVFHKSLYCSDYIVLTIRFHSTKSIFNNWHYSVSVIFSQLRWEMRRIHGKIGQKASYLEPMKNKKECSSTSILALSRGSQESDWNFIFGVTNFWLVRFLQPVITSNVSVGLHCYLKTLTQVLYNFPIFPATSVLNCIGRWIFGIWSCQVLAMEDFMHWYTVYESEFWRDGGE